MSVLLSAGSIAACTIVCGSVWLCAKRRSELRALLHRFGGHAQPPRKDPSQQARRAGAALDPGEQLRRRAAKAQRQQQQRATRLAEELAEQEEAALLRNMVVQNLQLQKDAAQAAALAAMEVEWDEEADRSFARKLEQRERGKAAEMLEAAELEGAISISAAEAAEAAELEEAISQSRIESGLASATIKQVEVASPHGGRNGKGKGRGPRAISLVAGAARPVESSRPGPGQGRGDGPTYAAESRSAGRSGGKGGAADRSAGARGAREAGAPAAAPKGRPAASSRGAAPRDPAADLAPPRDLSVLQTPQRKASGSREASSRSREAAQLEAALALSLREHGVVRSPEAVAEAARSALRSERGGRVAGSGGNDGGRDGGRGSAGTARAGAESTTTYYAMQHESTVQRPVHTTRCTG